MEAYERKPNNTMNCCWNIAILSVENCCSNIKTIAVFLSKVENEM